MTDQKILEYIDRGANFYVSLFGRAEHMERVDREFYSFVQPRRDVYGICFVYNVHLDGLPLERQKEAIAEIKALGMPVWLDLSTSEEAFLAYTGREKPALEPATDGEAYLAMLPEEKPDYPAPDLPAGFQVVEVQTQAEFAAWAGVANQVLSGGKEDIHPQYHYPLCRDGLLRCYMLLDGDGKAVSTASAAVDRESVSLEFVAVLPERRRQGLAKNLCRRVVEDAFRGGAAILTVRAIDGRAAALYRSVGFRNCR